MQKPASMAKLELILERHRLGRALEILENRGVRGWTVVSAEQGRGHHGIWHASEPTGISEHVLILAICPGEVADRAMGALGPHLESLAAILVRSEVQVLRPSHFGDGAS